MSTMTIAREEARADDSARRRRPIRPARVVLYVFLSMVALGWLAPAGAGGVRLASAVPGDREVRLLLAGRGTLSLHYYSQAWSGAEMPRYFRNTLLIAVPAVLLVLFLASFVAFALSRFKLPGRKTC